MDALLVIVKLLEKASVLVAVVLVLALMRPAGVWLDETGRYASFRRRLFLVATLTPMAIWGVFLGLEIGGQTFNVRMLGIVVAGFLGGRKVGSIVGAFAGAVYAYTIGGHMAGWAFAASVLVGFSAGWWSRNYGTKIASVAVGATVVQLGYHVVIGGILAAFEPQLAIQEASNLELHIAKIVANVVGATVFMALLNLVGELERLKEEAHASATLARSAKLEALQYQIRPHFLFNLLNTLSYLIRTDPTKARDLTLDLSDFLRYTLSNEHEETTLRDELKQIERYVELERARFGNGLGFEIIVAAELDLAAIHVPPLILQPLVENAIQHGAKDGQVNVKVVLTAHEDTLSVEILDDGPGPGDKPQTPKGGRVGGLGLRNVRERLSRYFDHDVDLELADRTGTSGARVSFRIPYARGLSEQAKATIKSVVR